MCIVLRRSSVKTVALVYLGQCYTWTLSCVNHIIIEYIAL